MRDRLAEVVAERRAAIRTTPPGHPDRATRLSNLAAALHNLFGRTGDLNVLTEAVALGREAVSIAPAGHPDRDACLNNLGIALRVLTVMAISRLHLTGDLAYLSACRTSDTSPHLADEAIHITAACQLAGDRHVIGTRWPAGDLAADVYTLITATGTQPPDTARAAHALHHATRLLRAARPTLPALWASHIHVGT